MRNAILALLCSAFLATGCGTIAVVEQLKANPDQDLLEAVATVTVADSQAALDDANAHNDKVGAACWMAINKYAVSVEARLKASGGVVPKSGALLAVQKARDVMLAMDSGAASDVAIGCAALEKDMAKRGVKLAALIAAASHGVPPLSVMQGGLGSLLPK